jgi:hypothetical protein
MDFNKKYLTEKGIPEPLKVSMAAAEAVAKRNTRRITTARSRSGCDEDAVTFIESK